MSSYPNTALIIAMQAGVSAIAWGGVGVAKNAFLEAMMRALGYVLHVFIPSQHAPEDIGGIPYHDPATGCCRMVPMDWMLDMKQPKRALFIDEATSAPTQMRPPLLSCLNERRVGDLVFHPSSIVLAAANPPELAPNGAPLEASMLNRLFHCEWEVPYESWLEGLERGGDFRVPDNIPIISDSTAGMAKWGRWVARICRDKPTLRNTTRIPEDEFAFPTPRSWFNLVKCMAAADTVQASDEVYMQLGNGLVGKGATAELLSFVDNLDLYDVDAVLTGQCEVEYGKDRVDQLVHLPGAILTNLRARLAKDGSVERKIMDKACEVLIAMGESDMVDSAIPAMSEITDIDAEYTLPKKLFSRYGAMLAQIGGDE